MYGLGQGRLDILYNFRGGLCLAMVLLQRALLGFDLPVMACCQLTVILSCGMQVTSYQMALAMESEVVGGPTAQGQPVFEWGDNWPGFEHQGMPDRFEFEFEKQSAAELHIPGKECTSSTTWKASTAVGRADDAAAALQEAAPSAAAASAAPVQDRRPLARALGPVGRTTSVEVA
jgi:hypothetical protein